MNSFIAVLAIVICGLTADAQSTDSIQVIPTAQFAAKIDSVQSFQLVDVRTPKEYQEGHIKGSINVDVLRKKRFRRQIRRLDRKQPVLLYCRSGKRSHDAAILLQRIGFSEVIELEGGFQAWNSSPPSTQQ